MTALDASLDALELGDLPLPVRVAKVALALLGHHHIAASVYENRVGMPSVSPYDYDRGLHGHDVVRAFFLAHTAAGHSVAVMGDPAKPVGLDCTDCYELAAAAPGLSRAPRYSMVKP